MKQNDALMDQYATNSVRVKELTIIADNNKHEIRDIIDMQKEYDQTLKKMKGENQVLHKQDLAYKTKMYEKQRTQEETLKDMQDKRVPIVNKINMMSITNARTYKESLFDHHDERIDDIEQKMMVEG